MALTPAQERAMIFEGFREEPYLDNRGYPTIGIGEKLEDIQYTKEQGVPYHLQHERRTKDQSIENLQEHWSTLEEDVASRYGEDWEDLPQDVRDVVMDLSYNMGAEGLFTKFPGFLEDVQGGNYQSAAQNLKYKDPAAGDNPANYSDWWNQVGGATTETNENTGEWSESARSSNRATSNYDVLMGQPISEDLMVENTMKQNDALNEAFGQA